MKSGLRVLVVEDEMMVALLAEAVLTDLGHLPVGPALRLEEALLMVGSEVIDVAMLDVNLGDAKSFPIADLLRSRGIPFFFATGYGIEGLSAAYRDELVIEKPYFTADINRALGIVMADPAGRG